LSLDSSHKLYYVYMTDIIGISRTERREEDVLLNEEVVFCGWTLVVISCFLVCLASSTTASRKGRWEEDYISVLSGGVLWLALDVTSSLSVFVAARTEPSKKGRWEEDYISLLRGGVL
jgi:hypothetical protein